MAKGAHPVRNLFVVWILAVILSLFWPPAAGLVYKAIKGSTEFDGVFKGLVGTRTPTLSLLVGGGSYAKNSVGFKSKSWGFHFELPADEKGSQDVCNGLLASVSDADYVVWFHGNWLPTAVVVARNTSPHGEKNYKLFALGFGPIRKYILFIVFGWMVGIAFLEATSMLRQRKKEVLTPT